MRIYANIIQGMNQLCAGVEILGMLMSHETEVSPSCHYFYQFELIFAHAKENIWNMNGTGVARKGR